MIRGYTCIFARSLILPSPFAFLVCWIHRQLLPPFLVSFRVVLRLVAGQNNHGAGSCMKEYGHSELTLAFSYSHHFTHHGSSHHRIRHVPSGGDGVGERQRRHIRQKHLGRRKRVRSRRAAAVYYWEYARYRRRGREEPVSTTTTAGWDEYSKHTIVNHAGADCHLEQSPATCPATCPRGWWRKTASAEPGCRQRCVGAGLAVRAVILRCRQSFDGGLCCRKLYWIRLGKRSSSCTSVQPNSEHQRQPRSQPLECDCVYNGNGHARPASADNVDGDADGHRHSGTDPAAPDDSDPNTNSRCNCSSHIDIDHGVDESRPGKQRPHDYLETRLTY